MRKQELEDRARSDEATKLRKREALADVWKTPNIDGVIYVIEDPHVNMVQRPRIARQTSPTISTSLQQNPYPSPREDFSKIWARNQKNCLVQKPPMFKLGFGGRNQTPLPLEGEAVKNF